MVGSQGYSLEQLLAWSIEDCLIDGYERAGDLLVIVQGKLRREMPFQEARDYLKGMFRQHARLRRLDRGERNDERANELAGLARTPDRGTNVSPAGWMLRTG